MTAVRTEGTPMAGWSEAAVLAALELGSTKWVVAVTTGDGRVRIRQVPARNPVALAGLLRRLGREAGLPEDAAIVTCHEAGRDGFSVHRMLEAEGIRNVVMDSSSIKVNRRARRAKTDRLDAQGLLRLLQAHRAGDHDAFRVVRVPTLDQEMARHLHREQRTLKQERVGMLNRIKGLLATMGATLPAGRLREAIGKAMCWKRSPLPEALRLRLEREVARVELLDEQLKQIGQEQLARVRTGTDAGSRKASALMRMRGVGPICASVLSFELFGWRQIRNSRELGQLAGLTATPYQSDGIRREQGIGKSGNPLVRWIMVEIAHGWLRWQPDSELTKWFDRRFRGGSVRVKKTGLVALARKLLVAFWRFLNTGVPPAGATLKSAAAMAA